MLRELDAKSDLSQSKSMQCALQQAPCSGPDSVVQIQRPARKKLVFDVSK